MYGLRVILADTDESCRKFIKEKLLNAGHTIIGETANGRQALQMIFNMQPDLAILGIKLSGRDGVDLAKTIEEHRVAPVLLVAEPERQYELSEALEDWTISYILKPVDETNLIPAIEVCRAIFKKMCRLEDENRKLKQTLETRKIVDKAKSLLVRYNGMTEQDAYKHIHKISMDKSMPIKFVAKQIIASMEGTNFGTLY